VEGVEGREGGREDSKFEKRKNNPIKYGGWIMGL
jgi:hypothetical protein